MRVGRATFFCGEADAFMGLRGRSYDLPDGVEDDSELRVVLFLQFVQAGREAFKLVVLVILVTGLVYLLNQFGPLGADTKTALKYLWLGLLGIAALGLISVTLLGLAAIMFGIPFIKSMAGANGGFWSRKRHEKGSEGFLHETVGGALKGAFGAMGDLKKLTPRTLEVSIDTYPYDHFRIKTLRGDIEVSGHDLPGAKAELEIMEKEEGDTEAFFEDGEIKLKTKTGAKSVIGDAEIFLPGKLARLDVESLNGDIEISGFATAGPSAFKGVNGDISVSKFSNGSEVSVKTVSGDVEINESQLTSLLAQSISGDIQLKDTAADTAALKTVSGDIDYAGCDIKDPTVTTVNGSITK
ncbi:MAG: hypothetical protein COT18_03195 [Elusimicrobia bacterium CG08_land_8_20_14_0_20_59_10]|nr:MAG: hypothetical protein COT18_03195 [Elusimicrobia bacterium CG08_land_8_20_14_0_20_59_10]